MIFTRYGVIPAQNKLLVFDDFNRADNANSLGTAVTGQPWSVMGTGVWGINGNKSLKKSGSDVAGSELAYIDSGKSDVIISVNIVFASNAGIAFRIDSVFGRYLVARISTTSIALYKIIDQTSTLIGEYAFSPTVGQTYNVMVIASGQSIKVYLDGALRMGVLTVSDFVSNTRHGLRSFSDFTSKYDDFKVEVF